MSYLLSVLILSLQLYFERHNRFSSLDFTNTFQTELNLCGQQSYWQAYSLCELTSPSSLLRQHSFLSNNVAGSVCVST